jgi:iron complex transport system substrate-binding protein
MIDIGVITNGIAKKGFALAVLLILVTMSLSGCTQSSGTQEATPAASATPAPFKTVTDMRGKAVQVPADIKRVATIDDGFVEGIMTSLGVVDKVVAIGSWSIKRDYKYDFTTVSGQNYSYTHGWNTMHYLNPWLNDTPCMNSPQGNILSYETLATVNPDVLILRVGDCTVSGTPDVLNKTIDTIESMGIPLIVIYSPTYYKNSDLSTMKDEISVIGDLFGKKQQAIDLADYLASTQKMIIERTKDVPESQKPRVLYIGLSPNARQAGGAGSVWGVDTPESYIIETIVNAKNAYTGTGSSQILNPEQILALDPDVILLPTANGFHPPRELMEAPYYTNLQELRAVKNKRVYAMPWTPMNCARRVEYPIDLLIIAKAAYPDKFQDIKINQFALDFYKKVYGVNDTVAKELRSNQWLDWTVDANF